MSKRIAPSFIETLKDHVDIVSVINSRVPLKKAGKDYQACCPFHNEKTPSFTVSAQKQFYYCFGCGAKGNALNFVMEFEHLSFVDAVEKLAADNGITVEYEALSKSTVAKIERQKTLHDYLVETANLFANNLHHQTIGASARTYLSERQLDKETTEFFGLGYSQSGNTLHNHFGRDVSPAELKKAGLLACDDKGRYYDFFRDRLMFPIRDTRGRVVGFGARALGEAKPKYLNTGDTEVFNKSNTLYGLYEVLQSNRRIDHLVVVEGYMDVIALHQLGVCGAVAALGTAFTQGHLNLVRKYSKNIFICFDGDNAGKKAAERAMALILPAISTETKIRIVFLPDGEDPDTLVRKIGATAFNALLEKGQYFSEFICDAIIADSDVAHIEERGEISARAKSLLDTISDNAFKNMLIQQLETLTGFDVYHLESQPIERVKDSTRVEKTPKTPVKSNVPQGKKPLRAGVASALMSRLLLFPHMANGITHARLMLETADQDSGLFYRLIQYCQFNSTTAKDDAQFFQEMLNAFESPLRERLLVIKQHEKVPDITNETVEQRQQRIQTEFFEGLAKVFADVQQKLAHRA